MGFINCNQKPITMSLITLDDIVKLPRFNNVDNTEIQAPDGIYIKFEDAMSLHNRMLAQCRESIRKFNEKNPDYYKPRFTSSGTRCSVCGSSKAKQQQFTTESGTLRPVMCDSCFGDWMFEDYDV